jgi:hypothetical protein
MLEIMETLEWIGLEVEGRSTTFEELCAGPFPVIAHVRDHFVVVEEADAEQVTLSDRSGPARTVKQAEFAERWAGKLLRIEPPTRRSLLPASAGDVPRGAPRICFDTLLVDAGEIDESQDRAQFSYRFENGGEGPLQIARVRTDCGCAVGHKPTAAIPPGGAGRIVVDYQPEQGKGAFERTAFVDSNDPVFPTVQLRLVGTVANAIQLRPRRFHSGEVVSGGEIRRRLFVTGVNDRDFGILEAVSSDGSLRWSCRPLNQALAQLRPDDGCSLIKTARRGSYVVDIALDTTGWPMGRNAGVLEFTTSVTDSGTITVAFTGEIVEPVLARPSQVFLGELRAGIPAEATLKLSSRDGSLFRVLSVATDVKGLDCDFSKGRSSEADLAFRITPAVTQIGSLEGRAVIQYAQQRGEMLHTSTVPVYGYVN